MSFTIIIQFQGGTCSQPATNDVIITSPCIYTSFSLYVARKNPDIFSNLVVPIFYLEVVPPSICCLFCSPCNGVGPLADGSTASLLQILRGNEGEIIRSYLHISHITGPTRPISTTSSPVRVGEN